MAYMLTGCSTADLSQQQFDERNIGVAFFHFEVDGKEYLDDMGKSLPSEELFHMMDAGANTHTSQISVGEYTEFWEQYLKEGMDILHVTLSSGISGTYQSAMIAKGMLESEYPDRKIYVVDSLAASSGYGLLLDALADKRDEGMDLESLYAWAEANKSKVQHWFFSTDLTYYIRGGRISKTSGLIGQALGICPLLNVDFEGKLIPREKIRTKKKTIKRTVEVMESRVQDGLDYSGKCYISHSLCYEDAKDLATRIEEKFPKLDGKVEIYPIGATIGSHTGPGTIALFFWGDERID
ncbi:MAG: DegV family protein [Lachnospiraceae bacterium]|nr:DegV family protein [Lachnospiraceae bacterium]